ncbi:MAG: type II secretion system protein [Verrucomicrobiota bacterium]|jgi:prepilin-type N-terminal cleavage/methylation domain-containing protein
MKQTTSHGSSLDFRRPEGFTLIELLVVIAIIGILASLIVGLSGVATSKARLSQTKALLHNISTAIDSYQADLGSFPPDAQFRNGVVNAATNQLYYELTGSVYNNQGSYRSLSGSELIRRETINGFFGVDGFQNVARQETEVKGYLDVKGSQAGTISLNPEVRVLTAPIPWPIKPLQGNYQNVLGQNIPMENLRPIKSADPSISRVNPWQYRSSGLNRFNQQSYDLWADIVIGTKVYRVNNWGGAPKVYEALPPN